jgi:1,4-alpha-glucan branching enzyme
MLYAWHENFVLPLSHDEVVHGKGSLLGKMAGMGWDEFANLRALYGYMYGQAAKKLLFMGGEIGQRAEWNHDGTLEWPLLEHESHAGIQKWVRDLNWVYRSEPALHELDCEPDGFQWVDCNDADQSLLSFLRRGHSSEDLVLVACNFTPLPRSGYRLGVPRGGLWQEILNSDATDYWGQGFGNLGGVEATPTPSHGHPFSVEVTLPPLGVVFFKSAGIHEGPGLPTATEEETGTEKETPPLEEAPGPRKAKGKPRPRRRAPQKRTPTGRRGGRTRK